MSEQNNQNIIFLDLDGVIEFSFNDEIYFDSIKLLQEIISKYNAKIVLITSLLGIGTMSRYKELVAYMNGLGIDNIIDKIDVWFEGIYNNQELSFRTLGIVDYLKNNKNINYVIFDDDYDSQYSLLGLNYVKPDYNIGLQKEDLKSEIFQKNNLNLENISYHYRSLENAPYVKATNDLVRTIKSVYELKRR